MIRVTPRSYHSLRWRVHELLDGGSGDWLTRLAHRLLIALVVLSVGAVVLESVPEYADEYHVYFRGMEYVAVASFTVEYLVRLWCAPEDVAFAGRGAFGARIAYIKSGAAIIDFVSILPFYLSFVLRSDLYRTAGASGLRFDFVGAGDWYGIHHAHGRA